MCHYINNITKLNVLLLRYFAVFFIFFLSSYEIKIILQRAKKDVFALNELNIKRL